MGVGRERGGEAPSSGEGGAGTKGDEEAEGVVDLNG